jgi:DNA-binding protein HU-beta
MNRKELLDNVLGYKGMETWSRRDAETFLNHTLETIKKAVRRGDDVSLIGFGTFTRVKRKARAGVNPSTGEKIKIKAKTLPKFRPGKAWKEML